MTFSMNDFDNDFMHNSLNIKKLIGGVKKQNDDDDEDDDENEYDDDNENEIKNSDDEDDDIEIDDDDDIEIDDYEDDILNDSKINNFISDDEDSSDDEDDEDDEKYLQKFNKNIKKNIISEHHPELQNHNYEEVESLCRIVRDENGIIIDPLHRTLPFLTKYEKARILGERSKQIECGAIPFIKMDDKIIDSYVIALKELELKRIPFIIKRPLPNGACEYWKLSDLEYI
jgi:DNA-directed RNA polymerase I, II, and III subunit RPABC2